MCQNTVKSAKTSELLLELFSRNIFTNSKSNKSIVENLCETNLPKLIATMGIPEEPNQCRECGEILHSDQFQYYQSRVDKNGYLIRSNALCLRCSYISNKDRNKVLDNALVGEKPKKGDICPHCERAWEGNWHRHHKDDQFIGWLCGHCNMSFSDQRNKKLTNNI